MPPFAKLLSGALLLFVAFMGIKQGWAILSGKAELVGLLERWAPGIPLATIVGAATLLSAVLILIPRTFFAGNFLMAATILLLACVQLSLHNLRGAALELPFLALNLLLIYLAHPLRS